MTSQVLESANHSDLVPETIYDLKKLQHQAVEVDAEFHRAIWDLECQFQEKYRAIYEKRDAIVNGELEGIENDRSACDSHDSQAAGNASEDIKGVPDFWLNVLKNSGTYLTLVHENDLPILKYLTNIQVYSKPEPEMSFTLEFLFAANPYFRNQIITKKYFLTCTVDSDSPFDFDGPEIYRSQGCDIDWNESHLDIVKENSFFNFFKTPELSDYETNSQFEELRSLLQMDFEMGLFIKERIIPRAVSYYLKEEYLDIEYDSSSSMDSTDSEEEYETETIGDAKL